MSYIRISYGIYICCELIDVHTYIAAGSDTIHMYEFKDVFIIYMSTGVNELYIVHSQWKFESQKGGSIVMVVVMIIGAEKSTM